MVGFMLSKATLAAGLGIVCEGTKVGTRWRQTQHPRQVVVWPRVVATEREEWSNSVCN